MKHLDFLNPAQQEAVFHAEGPLLVLAGAGAGKTRVIAHRILELVRRGADPSAILAITFTNKAAREMRERVYALLRSSPELNLPVFEYGAGPFISTFHSLGLHIIKEHFRSFGFKRLPAVWDRADSLRAIKRALKDLGAEEEMEPRAVFGAISRAKGSGVSMEEFAEGARNSRERLIASAWEHYERELAAEQSLDFDDLLLKAVRFLSKEEVARERYRARWRYVHIDEYQDTNEVQASLMRLLVGPEKNVCAVGDLDQCLASGTLVTMANGTRRRIEALKVGDSVLSNYGSGDLRPARVIRVRARIATRLISLRLRSGAMLTSTPDHVHFAGYRTGVSPQMHFTYLMYKRGVGYRLGVSQTYTNGQRAVMPGFVQRCNQEHADAAWVLAAHANPQDARVMEYQISLCYGIPTVPFIARKGGSVNGYVHDQRVIDRIFQSANTEAAGAKLLGAFGLSPEAPHHRPQSRNSNRRAIVMSLCGDRRGTSPMHRIAMIGNDVEGRRALESLELSVRPAKRGSKSWRFETCRADYGELLSIARRIATVFPDACMVEHARLGGEKRRVRDGNSLPFTAASAVRPGMAMFNERGGWDIVESVAESATPTRVYDLDIEKTHTFIANGIATHNCIYTWRGAEIKNILSFEKEFPGAKVVVLEENYRSTQNILAAANEIIGKNVYRVEKNMFTKNAKGAKLSLYQAFDETDEALYVARTIQGMIAEGARPRDFAALYRANFQSRALEEALLAADIPYQVLGTRFFERAEVKDTISYIRAAVFATSADIARAANTPRRGIGKTTLLALLTGAEERLAPGLRQKIASFKALLARIREAAAALPPSKLVQYVVKESGIERELKADNIEGPERLENLRELISLAARYDPSTSSGQVRSNEEGLQAFLENAALGSEQDELKDEADAVRLMTVHASKGLEFPYVFVTGLEEGLFPHEREGEEKEDEEEERRLMYVAVTRAERKVFLTFAMSRALFGARSLTEPSRFIGDISEEYIELEKPERLGKTIYLE